MPCEIVLLLEHLRSEKHNNEYRWVKGSEIQKAIGLTPKEINTMVELGANLDLVEVQPTKGTSPYFFNAVRITSEGVTWLELINTPGKTHEQIEFCLNQLKKNRERGNSQWLWNKLKVVSENP